MGILSDEEKPRLLLFLLMSTFDIMSISYTNRKGQKYYLHVGDKKTGKPNYYFSSKVSCTPLANVVPPGREIYENPDGQVFLRRALPKLISDAELEMVEKELGRVARLKGSRLERKLRVLTVYLADRK